MANCRRFARVRGRVAPPFVGLERQLAGNRGFGTVWGDAAQFETFMDKGDAQMGVAMKAAGLSKA